MSNVLYLLDLNGAIPGMSQFKEILSFGSSITNSGISFLKNIKGSPLTYKLLFSFFELIDRLTFSHYNSGQDS